MSGVTLQGAPVLSGRIAMGLCGPWRGLFSVASDEAITGAVTVECEGGTSFAGTARRGGWFAGVADLEVVGGAGGLGVRVRGAYQRAQLGEVLSEIASASGEQLAADIDAAVRAVALPAWTLTGTAAAALSDLAGAAALALGAPVHWRIRPDGKLWIGVEAWTATAMPDDVDLVARDPALGEWTFGVPAATWAPGIDLDTVGRVVAVEHRIEDRTVRSLAWT